MVVTLIDFAVIVLIILSLSRLGFWILDKFAMRKVSRDSDVWHTALDRRMGLDRRNGDRRI